MRMREGEECEKLGAREGKMLSQVGVGRRMVWGIVRRFSAQADRLQLDEFWE